MFWDKNAPTTTNWILIPLRQNKKKKEKRGHFIKRAEFVSESLDKNTSRDPAAQGWRGWRAVGLEI
jgi:hypothetical protein